MSATNDVQRAVFDSLSEKQIDQCRAILIYHLGGRQEKWPLDRHDKAGGYDLPLTASERELTHLTKNHVIALILRICGVEETVHALQSTLAAKDETIAGLRSVLTELVAMVRGECASLLDEDRGGDSRLSLAIDDALAAQPVASEKAELPADPDDYV